MSTAQPTIREPLIRALLVLTFTAGLVDAVTFVGLGRVFAANMTGNVLLLGFGIAGNVDLPVVAPIVSLAAFLLGAGLGASLALRLERHVEWVTGALALEASLLGAAAVFAAVVSIRVDAVSGDLLIALLALAMGLRNVTIRRLSVPDLTTTVLTGTLTNLAAHLPLFGGSGEGTVRRTATALSMLVGAVAGALLLKTSAALPLAAATALALVTLAAYVPYARKRTGSLNHGTQERA
jgi:uncharacterized membrane protein YoaK (UPF0700 family)